MICKYLLWFSLYNIYGRLVDIVFYLVQMKRWAFLVIIAVLQGKTYRHNYQRHIMGILDNYEGTHTPGRAPCILFTRTFEKHLNDGGESTNYTIVDLKKVVYVDPPEEGKGEEVDDDDGK